MRYSIVITETAKRELLDAVMYIKNDLKNPQAASNLYSTANYQFNSLSALPKRNAEINPFVIGIIGIRYIAVKNYLAFYTVDDETMTVKIIRFVYSKSNWQNIIKLTFRE